MASQSLSSSPINIISSSFYYSTCTLVAFSLILALVLGLSLSYALLSFCFCSSSVEHFSLSSLPPVLLLLQISPHTQVFLLRFFYYRSVLTLKLLYSSLELGCYPSPNAWSLSSFSLLSSLLPRSFLIITTPSALLLSPAERSTIAQYNFKIMIDTIGLDNRSVHYFFSKLNTV